MDFHVKDIGDQENSNFTSLYTCVKIAGAQPGQVIAAGQTKGSRRGKSGLHRAGCRITSGGGDSKASATEIYRVSNEPCSLSGRKFFRKLAYMDKLSAGQVYGECRVTDSALRLRFLRYLSGVRVERQCKRLPPLW